MFRKQAVVPGLGAKAMAAGMTLLPGWAIRPVGTRTSLLPRP